jgi:S-adenosylmethionine:diacylglycerol 3-amino-3-carboxypropyl transferase
VRTREDVARDYRAAFLRYLPRRDEAALHSGYELGRLAVVDQVSVLDLVEVHHQILIEVLHETASGDVPAVASAASEFLIEVLATYDMSHRRLQ